MAERVLVDTNVVSFLGARKGPFEAWAKAIAGREAFVSFVTVGEIISGGVSAGWGSVLLAEWERKLLAYTVIPGTVDIAREFGRLHARFRGQMADDDLWIAATSLAHADLPLATADGGFDRIAAVFPLQLVKPRP